MAIGGSAKALLVGVGFAAGVVLLLWSPIGAGEDRGDESTTFVTPNVRQWTPQAPDRHGADRHGADWQSGGGTFGFAPSGQVVEAPSR